MLKQSVMTGKLESIGAINTSSLDNSFCSTMSMNSENVCSKCYSQNMLKTFRKSCRPAWKHNGALLSSAKLPTSFLPTFKEKYVRFNAHGELLNLNHLINLMNIVKKNPDTFFTLWTKRKPLIEICFKHDSKPSNLNLIYSSPKKNIKARVPKYFDKVFTVYTKEFLQTKNININCAAKKCIDCKVCYTVNDVKYINEVIK